LQPKSLCTDTYTVFQNLDKNSTFGIPNFIFYPCRVANFNFITRVCFSTAIACIVSVCRILSPSKFLYVLYGLSVVPYSI